MDHIYIRTVPDGTGINYLYLVCTGIGSVGLLNSKAAGMCTVQCKVILHPAVAQFSIYRAGYNGKGNGIPFHYRINGRCE
ncbi:hypothetical protein D3C73_534840 [compost metagenome]